jgi:hypothetical protein
LCFLSVAGLSGGTVHLPPIPAYVRGQESAAIQADHFVLRDMATDELVIVHPANFDTLGWEQNPGPMKSRRLPLGLGVEPSLSVRIQTGDRAGVYTYRYTIRNGPGALRGISQVVFDMPAMAGIESAVAPRGWGVSRWEIPEEMVAGREDALGGWGSWPKEYRERIKSRMVRKMIDWFSKPGRIDPNGTLAGMEIVSVNRPGLITAYFRSTYIATMYDDTPDVVGPLLASLHYVENNSVSLPIVAPKFPPAVAKTSIAQDFLDQIQVLIAEKELSAASTYIGELRAVLEAYVKGEDLPATERFRSLSPRPGNELERQIHLAVNLSFADGVPGSADTDVPEGRTR